MAVGMPTSKTANHAVEELASRPTTSPTVPPTMNAETMPIPAHLVGTGDARYCMCVSAAAGCDGRVGVAERRTSRFARERRRTSSTSHPRGERLRGSCRVFRALPVARCEGRDCDCGDEETERRERLLHGDHVAHAAGLGSGVPGQGVLVCPQAQDRGDDESCAEERGGALRAWSGFASWPGDRVGEEQDRGEEQREEQEREGEEAHRQQEEPGGGKEPRAVLQTEECEDGGRGEDQREREGSPVSGRRAFGRVAPVIVDEPADDGHGEDDHEADDGSAVAESLSRGDRPFRHPRYHTVV